VLFRSWLWIHGGSVVSLIQLATSRAKSILVSIPKMNIA
jgi:hypothetical protein